MIVKINKSKIVQCSVVGDGLVGKTSLVKKFVHNKHTENYVATVFDNFAGDVAVAGDKYTVSVFDTAGQQEYEGLRVFTYAQSDVIVVCYSAVDRDSFRNVVDFWVPEIRNYVSNNKPIILVATQNDLTPGKETCVTRSEGLKLANKIGASLFVESSVHDRDSIINLFENVVVNAIKRRRRKSSIFEKILRR
ncbi:cdc42 homolog [Mercenaria mercenaria]|uniref:cdc42 homolog n=1 Tax=Mercenaria mercenaria TaxID=6596 RepID=UPI001E1DE123|nr:cdc42 homolog [Mercenaria mercenaria]